MYLKGLLKRIYFIYYYIWYPIRNVFLYYRDLLDYMKRDSDEKRLKFLANIFVKLDKNNSFEEQILFDESYEASSLHKIKYYFDECSNVKFVNWSSGLVPIFIKKSIGCNIFLDKSTCSTDIEKYFFENELQFEFCEDQFSMTYDAVFSNNYIKEVALLRLNE